MSGWGKVRVSGKGRKKKQARNTFWLDSAKDEPPKWLTSFCPTDQLNVGIFVQRSNSWATHFVSFLIQYDDSFGRHCMYVYVCCSLSWGKKKNGNQYTIACGVESSKQYTNKYTDSVVISRPPSWALPTKRTRNYEATGTRLLVVQVTNLLTQEDIYHAPSFISSLFESLKDDWHLLQQHIDWSICLT